MKGTRNCMKWLDSCLIAISMYSKIPVPQVEWTKEKMNRILAQNTGKTYEEVQRDTERDNFMYAEEAKEYGLVDKVIVNR